MLTRTRQAIARVRAFFRRADMDRDLQAELESHIAMRTEDAMRRGVPREQAERQARLELGGLTQIREAHREVRGLPFLDALLQDLRYRTVSGVITGSDVTDQAASAQDLTISADLRGLTFQRILDTLMLQSDLFYRVMDTNTIMVFKKTVQNLQDFENKLIRTFYLSNADVDGVRRSSERRCGSAPTRERANPIRRDDEDLARPGTGIGRPDVPHGHRVDEREALVVTDRGDVAADREASPRVRRVQDGDRAVRAFAQRPSLVRAYRRARQYLVAVVIHPHHVGHHRPVGPGQGHVREHVRAQEVRELLRDR